MGLADKTKDEQSKKDDTSTKNDDPLSLSQVGLDLSVEDLDDNESQDRKINETESNKTTDMMDQTIVIGDIEAMNIFDDIKMN